jgi:hypothetical protein
VRSPRTGRCPSRRPPAWTPPSSATAEHRGAVALNPAPPDFYSCLTGGGGTVCHGTTSGGYQGQERGTCPQGFDILEDGFIEETAKRVYDRNGDLVRRVRHDRWDRRAGNVLYNSATGTSMPYITATTSTDVLATPGDFDSVTTTVTGISYAVPAAGGLLALDSGLFVFDAFESLVVAHGPQTMILGHIDKLCAELA